MISSLGKAILQTQLIVRYTNLKSRSFRCQRSAWKGYPMGCYRWSNSHKMIWPVSKVHCCKRDTWLTAGRWYSRQHDKNSVLGWTQGSNVLTCQKIWRYVLPGKDPAKGTHQQPQPKRLGLLQQVATTPSLSMLAAGKECVP